MRFPSEVLIKRSRFVVWGDEESKGYREYPVFRVKQNYDHYRFFGVQTVERIDELVGAADKRRR